MSPVSSQKVVRTVVVQAKPRAPLARLFWSAGRTPRPWFLGFNPSRFWKRNASQNGFGRGIVYRRDIINSKVNGSHAGKRFISLKPLYHEVNKTSRWQDSTFQVLRVPSGLFDQAKQRYLRTEICTQIFYAWWGKYTRPAVAREIVLEPRPVAPSTRFNPLIDWNIRFLNTLENQLWKASMIDLLDQAKKILHSSSGNL